MGHQIRTPVLKHVISVMPLLEALQFEGCPVIMDLGVGFGWVDYL